MLVAEEVLALLLALLPAHARNCEACRHQNEGNQRYDDDWRATSLLLLGRLDYSVLVLDGGRDLATVFRVFVVCLATWDAYPLVHVGFRRPEQLTVALADEWRLAAERVRDALDELYRALALLGVGGAHSLAQAVVAVRGHVSHGVVTAVRAAIGVDTLLKHREVDDLRVK